MVALTNPTWCSYMTCLLLMWRKRFTVDGWRCHMRKTCCMFRRSTTSTGAVTCIGNQRMGQSYGERCSVAPSSFKDSLSGMDLHAASRPLVRGTRTIQGDYRG